MSSAWQNAVNVSVRWLRRYGPWVPVGLFMYEYSPFTMRTVKGISMRPTFNPDDFTWQDVVLFDRFSIKTLHQYRRGDVVSIRSPEDGRLILKRIIALEGDVVRTLPPYPHKDVRVPKGRAWVEGDHNWKSKDSNHFGPIPLGLIEARLVFIVWPPNRMGPVPYPFHSFWTYGADKIWRFNRVVEFGPVGSTWVKPPGE